MDVHVYRRGLSRRLSAAILAAIGTLCLPNMVGGQEFSGGVIHTVEVNAPSLRKNMLGDPASRLASIYLPPSYRLERHRRYPVLYLLHGFDADNSAFIAGHLQNLNIRVSMDSLIAAGKVTEMIVVTPNARNRYDGSFYANSPVTGNWEDFIVRDLVGYMDSHFRTVKRREGRAIAGHSMGGFGALRVGMRHPEIFSVIYALSPYGLSLDTTPPPPTARAWMKAISLTDTSQLQFLKAGFNADLLIAENAVYASDPARPPLFVDFLFRIENGRLVTDTAVAKKWQAPLNEVPRYAANLRREKIGFDAGRSDGFPNIPRDVATLDRMLTEMGISHFAELYDGTHGNRFRARLEQVTLPFVSAEFEARLHLSRAASTPRIH